MTQNVDEMLKVLQKRLIKELKYNYPEYVDCVIWCLPCRIFSLIQDNPLLFC